MLMWLLTSWHIPGLETLLVSSNESILHASQAAVVSRRKCAMAFAGSHIRTHTNDPAVRHKHAS
jgi:hypothetical protein